MSFGIGDCKNAASGRDYPAFLRVSVHYSRANCALCYSRGIHS